MNHPLPYQPHDPIEDWIATDCMRGSGWTGTTTLYRAWVEWCEEYRVYAGSISRFSQQLRRRGWVKRRNYAQTRAGFECWKLKAAPPDKQ